MRIDDLTAGVRGLHIRGDGRTDIRGIAYSSHDVGAGYLFAAMKGVKTDGNLHIGSALEKGAAAVLSESPAPPDIKPVWIRAEDVREALALCADNYYGHPSREMTVVGVTGTKGKTTVTYLLESILNQSGASPGIIGTISYRGPRFVRKARRMTPEAPDLQAMMRTMRENGATHCLLEVSSHALDLKRVFGIDFDVAVFTNLSGEHMDYHPSMEDYFEAKKTLFLLPSRKKVAVINLDDPWGQKLKSLLSMGIITYGLGETVMVRGEDVSFSDQGIRMTVRYPAGRMTLSSPLIGRPNVYNILASSAAALALNIPITKIIQGIASLVSVPGRFQKIENGLGLRIFVDYAHTDDALKNLLETARGLDPGEIILVFGAGGNRDTGKRPRMGEAAGRLADWSIITSDNPRNEDPLAIIGQIETGIKNAGSHAYEIIPDRRTAIRKALAMGRPGDIVLIAGKGHEDYQIIGDRILDFDDVRVTEELLAGMKGGSDG